MKILTFRGNGFEENAYLIKNADIVDLIDPGFNFSDIDKYLKDNNLSLRYILLTHGHIDHIGELAEFIREYKDIKIFISTEDYPLLFDKTLNASDYFEINKKELKKLDNIHQVKDQEKIDEYIFHKTPGHTIGSMVIEYKGYLFTGDTLFKGTVGRTDLPTGSLSDLNHSLKYIASHFSKQTIILPGHYATTTLKDELKDNIYMRRMKWLYS